MDTGQFGTWTIWHQTFDMISLNIFFSLNILGLCFGVSLGPVGHRYEKKYFLSSDFCQQFELKVIIWCLGARNFANSKSISILRYAQQNIFWKHQKNSSYLATATNAGQNMLSLCSGLSHPYNKRRYSGEYIFSVAICKPHDPNVLFQPLVLCYI